MKMHEFKKAYDKFVNSKPATMVLSIAAAILIWFIVSVTLYPTTPVTFYNIPLVVETEGTSADKSGLNVVSCNVETVNVQIIGSRSKIGTLTEEDLIAYAPAENVSSAGETTLEIKVRSEKNVDFEVKTVSPAKASVVFDKIETRNFAVTASFPNLVVTAGHTMSDVTCEPSTIDITGPSVQLDEISKVVITSLKEGEIDSSHVLYTTDVTLYNAENSIIDPENLTIPTVNFKIDIPVMTQKTLPLSYVLRNIPSGFDEKWLRERLILSTKTLTFASNDAALANQESWDLGYYPSLSDIGLDYSYTFDVPEKEGIINQSGIKQVTLTLDSEGLSEREFVLSKENFSIVNQPENYDFNVITEELTIRVIGPTAVLDELSTSDIMVKVDLRNHNTAQSTSFTADTQVSFSNASTVWAAQPYRITIEQTERTSEATE